MTRIKNGFWSDVALDDGFYIDDKETDLICDWLGSYADALERAWVKRGADGDPKIRKHNIVRSFIRRVERERKTDGIVQ